MTVSNVYVGEPMDRASLERAALQTICACRYYKFSDAIDMYSSHELVNIIMDDYRCNNEDCDGGY